MVTPEKAEYPLIRTCQVPADGEEKLQVSLLPYLYGRQSQELSVGALPNFTYRSASPLPPDMVNTRLEAPEGTSRVKFSDWHAEPDWPVNGTPLVSSPPPGPGSPGSSPSTPNTTQENAAAPWASHNTDRKSHEEG